MRKIILSLFPLVLLGCSTDKADTTHYREKQADPSGYEILYRSGNWEHPDYAKPFESFGNQRIVVETSDSPGRNTEVFIPWRRSDRDPQTKDLIVVDASTNQVIEKRYILAITNESGRLIFKPNPNSSRYYIYFLPHHSTGSYYPKLEYNKPTICPDKKWVAEVEAGLNESDTLPMAKVIAFESIDDFNSFFPMEVIATTEEANRYMAQNPADFYLFPEYRKYPIRMEDFLPQRWVADSLQVNGLADTAMRGEYFTFQAGLYSPNHNLEDVTVDFTDLEQRNGSVISRENLTCFNLGGIDLNGKPFSKRVDVPAGRVQAFWFGLDVPTDAGVGTYHGQIIIHAGGLVPDTLFIKLFISSERVDNHGDDNPEMMSRLRWLNSTVGTDENAIIRPFTPVVISDKTLRILGRDIELNEFGLPENIFSYFSQEMTRLKPEKERILANPVRFEITDSKRTQIAWAPQSYTVQQSHPASATWHTINQSATFAMDVSGRLEYDGMLDYQIQVIAKEDITVDDIKLLIPMQEDAAIYRMGLGLKGGRLNDAISWKWDVTKNQEGIWLGNVSNGLQFVLRAENYERPLNTNFYLSKPLNLPPSWYNDGRGGINITKTDQLVLVENHSGERTVRRGDTLHFNIRFLITPFKLIDTKEHFNTRFVHAYLPIDSVIKLNGTIVNVHHANKINPYINYPFYNLKEQKTYIDEAHSKGIRVKLYNTIRELSYKCYELFALRSLGDEILNDGEGGGHSWLQEHLGSHYHSAWHATSVNDAAILNKGTSRWTNYYIEGINWLAKNQQIDGLYLDDIAFSRETVKRIANVLNANRDSWVIDLHSANQFNPRDGFINSAFLYMEHFPYISRLWFGEYFQYDQPPDYWLTEVSGIPFGLTGEMLEGGGHPYRGLVYGMTTRVYGSFNPGPIWKLFDDFGIAQSEMLGYWVERSPIKTNHKNIESTIYLKEDNVLIAIGSWSDKDETVTLEIDWKTLGFEPDRVRLFSPEIKDLQGFQSFDVHQPVTVKKNEGLKG